MLGVPLAPTCLTHASGVEAHMLALYCSTSRRLQSTSWCQICFFYCLDGIIVSSCARILTQQEWDSLPSGVVDQGTSHSTQSVCGPALLHC